MRGEDKESISVKEGGIRETEDSAIAKSVATKEKRGGEEAELATKENPLLVCDLLQLWRQRTYYEKLYLIKQSSV